MLLMVGISGAMYHAIYQNVKDNNNKSMKDYDKTKNHHNYIKYLTSQLQMILSGLKKHPNSMNSILKSLY